jgi:perosamine synthetase
VAHHRRIPLSEPVFAGNEWKYLKDCVDTRWVSSGGGYVTLFEERIAEYTGAKFAVSTVNGTAALHTALLVAGVKDGDRVLVPTLTFIATVNPVLYCGAIPVFVDSEEKTLNMNPEKAVEAIKGLNRKKQSPKALVVTHLYGHPCDLDPLLEAAHQYGIVVIEDACESLGSTYKGKMTGTLGDLGCLSFNGNKIITTGGGGMLLTNNPRFAEKARHLTTQARIHDVEYIHDDVGYNYRLTNLQAALGVAQLEHLDFVLGRKRAIAAYYAEHLSKIPGLRLLSPPPWGESNSWLNTVLFERKDFHLQPRDVMERMAREDIETRPIFSPLHSQRPFKKYNHLRLPVAEGCRGLNLPSSPDLNVESLLLVTEALKRIMVGCESLGGTVGRAA